MAHVPVYLGVVFVLITALAVWLFYRAAHNSRLVLGVLGGWLLLQGVVAASGFYTVASSRPPRLLLALGPPLGLLVVLFGTGAGRRFLDGLRLDRLTLLHSIRVPMELVLLGLYWHGAVPRLMTFEGRNWDVLSGLSAPMMFYLVFRSRQLGWRALLAWNVVCLGLLANIVVHAVLSAPTVVQRLAFEQPNVAILHFPFGWLPGCVVPLVLLAHLAAVRRLLQVQGSAVEARAAREEG